MVNNSFKTNIQSLKNISKKVYCDTNNKKASKVLFAFSSIDISIYASFLTSYILEKGIDVDSINRSSKDIVNYLTDKYNYNLGVYLWNNGSELKVSFYKNGKEIYLVSTNKKKCKRPFGRLEYVDSIKKDYVNYLKRKVKSDGGGFLIFYNNIQDTYILKNIFCKSKLFFCSETINYSTIEAVKEKSKVLNLKSILIDSVNNNMWLFENDIILNKHNIMCLILNNYSKYGDYVFLEGEQSSELKYKLCDLELNILTGKNTQKTPFVFVNDKMCICSINDYGDELINVSLLMNVIKTRGENG